MLMSSSSYRLLPALIISFLVIIVQAKSLPYHKQSQYAHRAVIQSQAEEALLPSYLRNPYYKTPR